MSTVKKTLTPEQKELNSIYNFYKDCEHGFATKDGYYGVPVMGSNTKLALIHKGDIIKICRNETSARNLVDRLRGKKDWS